MKIQHHFASTITKADKGQMQKWPTYWLTEEQNTTNQSGKNKAESEATQKEKKEEARKQSNVTMAIVLNV